MQLFFEPFVPRDRLMRRVTQLAGLRELLDSSEPEGILAGYRAVLELNPAITPAMVEKLLASRCVLPHNNIGLLTVCKGFLRVP